MNSADALLVHARRIAVLTGFAPTGTIVNNGDGAYLRRLGFRIASIRITAISPLRLLSTTAYLLSGVTATCRGWAPTATTSLTFPVMISITVTLPDSVLATKR